MLYVISLLMIIPGTKSRWKVSHSISSVYDDCEQFTEDASGTSNPQMLMYGIGDLVLFLLSMNCRTDNVSGPMSNVLLETFM